AAHPRNARKLIQTARKQDRRLCAAMLAAAVAHTPEAMDLLRGARTRMARKPSALSRELLRNFPKKKSRSRRRRRRKGAGDSGGSDAVVSTEIGTDTLREQGTARADANSDAHEASEDQIAEPAANGDETAQAEKAPAKKPRARKPRAKKAAPKAEAAEADAD
ncbi:MAG TPA: hypothetical protein PKB03_04385, partial [Baekduia sp.]|nr:hypothetical protein [Baekduia sp.]